MDFPLSRLTIDARAVSTNFRLLQQRVGKDCQVAAVVKADAYGIGIDAVVTALEEAGCTFFYVATLEEALALRTLTEQAIAILSGFHPDHERAYRHHRFIPVLNTIDEVSTCPGSLPAIWHVDTGMNRLGLEPEKVSGLLSSRPRPVFMMSHFSSADESNHSPSDEQVRLFDSVVPTDIPRSLCNSSAIFKDASWHRQQVRPGAALYGLNPVPDQDNPMVPVVFWDARILQIREVPVNAQVGYNRTHVCKTPSRLATIASGYADGFRRAGSNSSALYWNGVSCPVVGRVSMDLIVVDTSHLSGVLPQAGDMLEILGPHQNADQLAASWGTIGYEVLTSLGGRAERVIIS